jgi:UDP-N-acetylmuramoyl-L-alanyl-D-glutamate--2,6-diaminopimelate ligase
LLDGVTNIPIKNDIEISGFSLDSRHVQVGQVFVGLPGNDTDGRGYIDQAVSAGAAAVLYESGGWNRQDCVVPAFPIDNLRQKIGQIASRFYGFPSRALCVIGLTGTNGKTTCAGLLAQALTCLGHRTGFIGTVGAGLVGALQPQSLTTPDAVTLQAQLADLLQKGADSVCIEVSSHALDQGRVKGVEFDADAVGTFLQKICQLGLQSDRIRRGQALWLECPDETGPNGADESCSMTQTGKRLRQ